MAREINEAKHARWRRLLQHWYPFGEPHLRDLGGWRRDIRFGDGAG
jgi:hypothetical protein